MSEWKDPDRFPTSLDLNALVRRRACFLPLAPALCAPVSRRRPALPPGSSASRCRHGRTPPVVNTAEEAAAIRQLLPTGARILMVTSAFHMRRAQRLFERQGLNVLPFPVDFQARGRWAGPLWRDPTQWLPSARALDDSSRALRELIGRFLYRTW